MQEDRRKSEKLRARIKAKLAALQPPQSWLRRSVLLVLARYPLKIYRRWQRMQAALDLGTNDQVAAMGTTGPISACHANAVVFDARFNKPYAHRLPRAEMSELQQADRALTPVSHALTLL